jgi:hypothetical protein
MKFWQHILYPKEATEKLKTENEYEKKDKELKHNIAEADWKGGGYKKEKLYQRIFSAVLFLGGLALLFDNTLKEMGFFVMGSGLYGLVPESERKDQPEPNMNMLRSRLEKMGFFVMAPEECGTAPKNEQKDQAESKVNILKNQLLLTSIVSFVLIIVIITIQYIVFTEKFKENIGSLLWFFSGILTMCFITAFKRFINSRT